VVLRYKVIIDELQGYSDHVMQSLMKAKKPYHDIAKTVLKVTRSYAEILMRDLQIPKLIETQPVQGKLF